MLHSNNNNKSAILVTNSNPAAGEANGMKSDTNLTEIASATNLTTTAKQKDTNLGATGQRRKSLNPNTKPPNNFVGEATSSAAAVNDTACEIKLPLKELGGK